MQTANILLALGGDTGNTVPKRNVTAGEIAVLRAIHGSDAVSEVEPLGSVQRTSRAERQRLMQLYPARDREDNLIVSVLYPGAAARVFETLDELELDESCFKATSRAGVEAKSEAPADDEKDLDDMTVKELKDYAHAKQIDLAGATKKDDIITEIRNANPAGENAADDNDGVGEMGGQNLFQ